MRMSSQSGYVLVTVALMLAVLIGFTGLAVDLGTMLSARTQMQRAADAAALAGAFSFVFAPSDDEAASAKARQIAMNNTVLGAPIVDSEVFPVPVAPDHPNRGAQMKVTIRRTLPTFFARILGFNELTVSSGAESIAEVGPAATGSTCVKPWFVPNTALSDPLLSPCAAYDARQLLVDTRQTTLWATQRFGQQFTLKSQDPNGALSASQFYAMQLSGGGAANYKAAITGCDPTPVICRTSYRVEPGNMNGPTRDGVETLIGSPPDIYSGPGRYQWSNGTIHDTSKSLVLLPIVDVTLYPGFCPNGTLHGANAMLPVVGFALVFVDGLAAGPNGDVIGRVVNVLPCGEVAPSGNELDGTVYGFPIRLVRPLTES